jgi:transposase-like protein
MDVNMYQLPVRLHREVKDLREENERLKKVAAYFAKNQQ